MNIWKRRNRVFPLWAEINICLAAFLVGLLVILTWSGTVGMQVRSFAVLDDRLYVGFERKIELYEEGTLAATLPSQTFRGYVLAVEDGLLIQATPEQIYVFADDGAEIHTRKDKELYHLLQSNHNSIVLENADQYVLHPLLWPRIVKNGTETVYRLPAIVEMCRISLVLILGELFCVVLYLVSHQLQKKQHKADLPVSKGRCLYIRAPKSSFSILLLELMFLFAVIITLIRFILSDAPLLIKVLFGFILIAEISLLAKKIWGYYHALNETLLLDESGIHYLCRSHAVEIPWEEVRDFGKYSPFWTMHSAVYFSRKAPIYKQGLPSAAQYADICFSAPAYKGIAEVLLLDADDCIAFCGEMTRLYH